MAKSIYIKKTLKNKLTVFLIPRKEVRTFYANLYIKVGSAYENSHNQGISHFLEHYHHEGTINYPNILSFYQAIEAEGLYENAATSLFTTLYWVAGSYKKAKVILEFLYEIVFRSLLPATQLEKTKKIILNEINDFWSDPYNQFKEEMFDKRTLDKTIYNHFSFGQVDTVKKITLKDLICWKKTYYQPKNMILTIVGRIQNNIFLLIEKFFSQLKNEREIKKIERPKVSYSDFLIHYKSNQSDQIYFILTFPAFGYKEYSSKKVLMLYLLNYALGKSRVSSLLGILREKYHLVYYITTSIFCYPYLGMFVIRGSCHRKNLKLVMELIKKEIDRIKKVGLNEPEIKVAKNLYQRDMVDFNFETPQQINQWVINEYLYHKKILMPDDYIAIIKLIRKKDVDNLANRIFNFNKLNIGLFGDITNEEINQIKKVFL